MEGFLHVYVGFIVSLVCVLMNTATAVFNLFRCFSYVPGRSATFLNKRHAMHAEAMTFHKGSLRIFRKFDRKFQES